jgi:hypothetical protein
MGASRLMAASIWSPVIFDSGRHYQLSLSKVGTFGVTSFSNLRV